MSHSDLDTTYDSKTDGKAGFFSPHALKSFYFELSALKWNFSYLDSDPNSKYVLSGTFYYNKDFFIKVPVDPIDADFRVQAVREGGLSAHIKFYAPGSKGEKDLLGEFLAKDHNNIVAGFQGRDERLPGKWKVVYSDKLEDRLKKEYGGRETKTNALFFKGGVDVPSFHLAVDELCWEFLHGGNPPTDFDIHGNLFYNLGFYDKEVTDSIKADFFVDQGEEDGKRYVLVKFFKPGNGDELLGEFLAADPNDKAKESGLLKERKEGQWKLLPGPDLEKELGDKYEVHEVADALFYKSGENQLLTSFRFEVYGLGLEVSDDPVLIGYRLPGILFCGDADYSKNLPTEGRYYIERKRGKGRYYAVITFYKPGANNVVWGEFLAQDPDNRAGASGLLKKDLKGKWKRVDYSTSSAVALKKKDSTKITLTLTDFFAEMQCKEKDEIFSDAFDVRGRFVSKTARRDGQYGNFVRWYRDRSIFFEDRNANDFSAFFFPSLPKDTLGSKDDLEWDVTWDKPREA